MKFLLVTSTGSPSPSSVGVYRGLRRFLPQALPGSFSLFHSKIQDLVSLLGIFTCAPTQGSCLGPGRAELSPAPLKQEPRELTRETCPAHRNLSPDGLHSGLGGRSRQDGHLRRPSLPSWASWVAPLVPHPCWGWFSGQRQEQTRLRVGLTLSGSGKAWITEPGLCPVTERAEEHVGL